MLTVQNWANRFNDGGSDHAFVVINTNFWETQNVAACTIPLGHYRGGDTDSDYQKSTYDVFTISSNDSNNINKFSFYLKDTITISQLNRRVVISGVLLRHDGVNIDLKKI